MKFPRRSGILLHLTSLPGGQGIGDLGEEAYRFIDFLVEAGQKLWQILPLNPIGYGDSPYSSPSAFAGNPLLISLEKLVEEGLLSSQEVPAGEEFLSSGVDFRRVSRFKMEILSRVETAFRSGAGAEEKRKLEEFCSENAFWLDDYSLYVSIQRYFKGAAWFDWPGEIALRKPPALEKWGNSLRKPIEEVKFIQYLFSRQWGELRRYANQRRISIIGDIPIFVSHDSSDVWAHRKLFLVDEEGRLSELSGVPPPEPSGTGQIWGNPLYDWKEMEKDEFRWWTRRFANMLHLVDIIRVDHFSGFYAFWHIPSGAETSAEGRWVEGPGASLFGAIERELGQLPIMAEALEPSIARQVEALLQELGFPGIRCLQFAFGGDADNPHRLENYPENCVVYTGTHDNDTCVGWYRQLDPETKGRILQYLGTNNAREINWKLIRTVLESKADTSIIPLQDILGLGSEARMNMPGREESQWGWRFKQGALTKKLAAKLKKLTLSSGR